MNGWVTIEDLDSGIKETIRISDHQPAIFLGKALASDSYLAWALLSTKPGDRFNCRIDERIHQMKVVASDVKE